MKTHCYPENETKRNIRPLMPKMTLLIMMLFGMLHLLATPATTLVHYPQDQAKLVKGRVVDHAGVPLPGVGVKVKGTSLGALSDLDGLFSLYVPERNSVLQFVYLGYKDEEIPADFSKEMVVVMEEDSEQIEETVVVG